MLSISGIIEEATPSVNTTRVSAVSDTTLSSAATSTRTMRSRRHSHAQPDLSIPVMNVEELDIDTVHPTIPEEVLPLGVIYECGGPVASGVAYESNSAQELVCFQISTYIIII